MKILALDQATKTGWAHSSDEGIRVGLWDFNVGKKVSSIHGTHGPRLRRLYTRLDLMKKSRGIDLIVAENVSGRMFGHAKIVLPAMRGLLELWCFDNRVPIRYLSPTAIKKHAVGKGNAKKERMVSAAKSRWPNLRIIDDNVADALWILDFVLQEK